MNNEETKTFHTLSIQETFESTESNEAGITEQEAKHRLSKFGRNKLQEGKKRTLFEMFIDQFKDVMIIILLVAAVVSGFLSEFTDTIIIAVVLLLNAVLGVIQESKAEKALAALKQMSSPYSTVKRDGHMKKIKSEELVPGDIVLLEAGSYVPADIRLIEAVNLKIEESALTGESVPVEKSTFTLDNEDSVIGDRKNMAYLSSSVTYGRGTGIVVGTGMNTEVGKIAGYLTDEKVEQTPLQKKLAEMGKYITIGILVIVAVIFAAGVLQQRDYIEMFMVAISLAVAAIPEGLPAVVTIVLALGVQRMAKRNSIVRKLPAVETLGSTQIICSDKTGTLTQNKMTVKEVFYNGNLNTLEDLKEQENNLDTFVQILTLCNDSSIDEKEDGSINFIGDPTETALVDFTYNLGIDKQELESKFPREAEVPFDSSRKLMTTINKTNGKYKVLTKGAPDVLINRCNKILVNGEIQTITDEHIKEIDASNTGMANKALRVLAVAYKEIDEIPENVDTETVEKDLIFGGLIGMIDPPRVEVEEAVRTCEQAGVRPIMITGDHKDTAMAIAKELNIIKSEEEAITGKELDEISDEDFLGLVKKYSVYARVSPEHKVRIVEAWKKNNKVVAMTGDGVNDAPALKRSDIGVGMGITGTDVSKGVSDMVLSDDNFATIVLAVEEGRKIYSNIRKAVQFLLSSNLGEVLTLFIGTLFGWVVLLPIHILWVNLVTDSLPALALSAEQAEQGVMKRKPRESGTSFFADRVGSNIILQGTIKGIITLLAYYIGFMYYSEKVAITMAFATLGLIQLAHSLNVRSNTKSLLSIGVFTNVYLIGAIAITALLQVIVIIVPYLASVFKVAVLSLQQWAIVLAFSISIIPIVEVIKVIQNKVEVSKETTN